MKAIQRHDITLAEWAEDHIADLDVVSASEPEPVLLDHNLVAVSDSVETARAVVLEWERIEAHDGNVGFVALGTPPERPDDAPAPDQDPRPVGRHAAARAYRGVLVGIPLGALVTTLVTFAFAGWTPNLLGATIGGGLLGGVAAATLSFATGTGWGAAYLGTFVQPGQTSVAVASIHSAEDEPIAWALTAATGVDDIRLYRVDRSGGTTEVDPRGP